VREAVHLDEIIAEMCVIETERLLLRKPRLEDAEAALEYLLDPEVMRFIGGVAPERDARPVVDKWLDRWHANGFGQFAVVRKTDDRFLGRAGTIVWDTRTWRNSTLPEAGEHAQPELGWALARAYWGCGYATEAAAAARDWVRREAGVDRLISLIAPENERSASVAPRLGARATETVQLEDTQAVVWVHPR
jgi:RimJ/RimL family protein N-acetyltransferase